MIRSLRARVVEPELLDEAPVEAARRNLAELITINRFLGGHRILVDQLRSLAPDDAPFTFLDIGAASGDMAQAAGRAFPLLRPINLDRRALHLERARGSCLVGDAFALPFADRALDFVHCSLFLHHFENESVECLLAEMWRVTRRALLLQDLERHSLPYLFLPATRWIFRWSDLILHDGPISVAAGFRRPELAALARAAGIEGARVRVHRPAFRLSLTAMRR